jgi:hypothetical protein
VSCPECGDAIRKYEAKKLGLSREGWHRRQFHAVTCSQYIQAKPQSDVRARIAGIDLGEEKS